MAHQVKCPACGTFLKIAKRAREAEFTCPHCLAKVPNPGVGIQTTLPASSPAPSAATEAPPPEQCPECGQALQARWQYCPFCNAELTVGLPARSGEIRERLPERRRQAVREEQPLDVEVRKDTTGSRAVLAVLACVLLAIVFVLLASGMPALGLLVIVLGAVVGGILLLSEVGQPKKVRSSSDISSSAPHRRGPRHDPSTTAAVAVATGVTAAAGGCALGAVVTAVVAIMIVMSVLAAIGNAIETCLTCGNPPARHK